MRSHDIYNMEARCFFMFLRNPYCMIEECVNSCGVFLCWHYFKVMNLFYFRRICGAGCFEIQCSDFKIDLNVVAIILFLQLIQCIRKITLNNCVKCFVTV